MVELLLEVNQRAGSVYLRFQLALLLVCFFVCGNNLRLLPTVIAHGVLGQCHIGSDIGVQALHVDLIGHSLAVLAGDAVELTKSVRQSSDIVKEHRRIISLALSFGHQRLQVLDTRPYVRNGCVCFVYATRKVRQLVLLLEALGNLVDALYRLTPHVCILLQDVRLVDTGQEFAVLQSNKFLLEMLDGVKRLFYFLAIDIGVDGLQVVYLLQLQVNLLQQAKVFEGIVDHANHPLCVRRAIFTFRPLYFFDGGVYLLEDIHILPAVLASLVDFKSLA